MTMKQLLKKLFHKVRYYASPFSFVCDALFAFSIFLSINYFHIKPAMKRA